MILFYDWCQALVLKHLPGKARGVTSSSVMFSVGVASSLLTAKNSIASDFIFKSSSHEHSGFQFFVVILGQCCVNTPQFNPAGGTCR